MAAPTDNNGGRHPTGLELSQFTDQDLPARRREEIAGHLKACEVCNEIVEDFRGLGRSVRDLPEPDAPDVAEKVLERRAAGERIDLNLEGVVYG